MDNFDFIFNGDKLFDFKPNEEKEKAEKAHNESNEIELLRHEMHVKNKIILNILEENKAYSEMIRDLVEKAETIPGTEEHINEVMKALNMRVQMNNLLKMAIEAEEAFDF